jgi:HupE/UreJ protein
VRRSLRRSGAGIAAALGVSLAALPARAHEPFSVTTEARALHDALSLHVTMAGRTATLACPAAAGGARRLTPDELARNRRALETCAKGLYVVTTGGRRLEPRAAAVALTEEGDFDARVTYPPAEPGPLVLEAVHLARLPDAMYGAELTVTGERVFLGQALLRAAAPSLTVSVPSAGAPPGAASPRLPTFGAYLRLGVEHLLTGYDHLAFLCGLLAVSRTFGRVLASVTAFTLAHSVTLALAALGVLSFPAHVVEPLIALTLVVIAVENLWRPHDGRGRWGIAFAFGLVHGLGFAGALARTGLGQPGVPLVLPLLGFNLGIEIAQAALATLAVPVLWRLRRWPAFERYGSRAISGAVGALGLAWFIERVG